MKNIIVSKLTHGRYESVSIVRISGEKVRQFVKSIIRVKLINQKAIYTKIYINKVCIDYGIVIFYKGPKSFTGEDIIEFNLHGGQIISEKLIKYLIKKGAKQAKEGEFIERRYLNGKISLIECEVINNKIIYDNENMFSMTNNKEKEIFLCIIKNLKFKINSLIICIEISNLNYSILFFKDFLFIKTSLKKFLKLINILYNKINKMNYLKKNFEIMIMGRRNVGKSTLFNKLCLQYDSIVTNIPGTTKNIIIKKMNILSKKIKMLDTAGIKIRTKNLIEKIGIIKNINKIYKGNIILYMVEKFNLKDIFYNIPLNFFEKIKANELIILINKSDKFGKQEGIYKIKNLIIIFISAKHGKLISNIKCFLNKVIDNKVSSNNNFNYYNTKILFDSFTIFYKEFSCNFDLMVSKLISFQKKMFKITGNYTNKIIRNSYFRNFCIGK